MRIPPTGKARKLKQAIGRQLPKRRDDSGLTTLEWLLIVAAVAGLAALAVVLVTNVVGDTSDQISGSSARKTAAELAAAEITAEARTEVAIADATPSVDRLEISRLNQEYSRDCHRLRITYTDIEELTVTWGRGDPNVDPVVFTAGGPVSHTDWNGAATGPFCRVT